MMYRKIWYFLLLWLLVISISGCAKKYNLDYNFDNYVFSMKTYEIFDNQTLSDVEKSQNIQMIAKQRNETGYIDSLLISDIDLSQLTLDKFMTLNKNTLESRFAEYEETKYSDLSFKCKWKEIAGKLLNYNLSVGDQTIYFSQYLFSNNKSGYMISLSTENEKQIKLLKKSIKDISCK